MVRSLLRKKHTTELPRLPSFLSPTTSIDPLTQPDSSCCDPPLPMAASMLRVAARGPAATTFFRANNNAVRRTAVSQQQPFAARAAPFLPTLLALPSARSSFATSARLSSEHEEETFEEFSAR